MSVDTQSLEVRNNPEKNRYEVTVNGRVALAQYRLHNNRITFTHTEVPDELGGQGIASKIAKFALEDAKAKGYEVKPLCPFIKGYIERHPEYQGLVVN